MKLAVSRSLHSRARDGPEQRSTATVPHETFGYSFGLMPLGANNPDGPVNEVAEQDRPKGALSGELLRRSARNWWALAIFLIAAATVTIHPPYANSPPIRSDGLGYHAWTRAILDGNISFCPYVELETVDALEPVSALGRCANKYPPGLALLRFPIMAPFTSANHGALRSTAEDRVSQILSVLAGAIAMGAAISAAARLGASRRTANLAALGVMFGTNEFHFATYDGSFTHIYSAAIVGLLLVLGIGVGQSSRPPNLRTVVAISLLTGLLVDIRMMLVAPLMVSALVLLAVSVRRSSVRDTIRRFGPLMCSAGGAVALALLQQLWYNHYIFGSWKLSAYAGEDFIWSQYKQLDVLFYVYKGAFWWSPFIPIALVAGLLARRYLLTILMAAVVLSLAVIYGAWHSWNLAGGFGHRGFVEPSALYAVTLAASAETLPRLGRRAIAVASVLATIVILGLMRAYWAGDIGFSGASWSEYVRFGMGRDSLLPHYLRELINR